MNLDWGLKALASDDIVYLSKFVKIIRELNNNDEVVELDEELPFVSHTRKRTFLGMPKCRKILALEWLTNDQVGQHSGLGGAKNDLGGDQNNDGAENAINGDDTVGCGNDNVGYGDENAGSGDKNEVTSDDNAVSGDENEASGNDNAASVDENDAGSDDNDNVEGVENIVNSEHIIDQVDVNMEWFRFTSNSDDKRDTIGHSLRPQLNINEDDLEVIDYYEFESDLDEDDIGSTRRTALRKLRKKGNASNESGIVNHFFLGQEFAFRAKPKAEETLKGDVELQYRMLRDYVMELKKCNPNTTVKIDVYRDEDPDSNIKKFRRIYVSLGALKDRSRAGGRYLLGLDGDFMKAPYQGQLFTAVSVDANNRIYHVTYGIVESESLDLWLWFCVRHICKNINLTWRGGAYKLMLWNCATATTIVQFNKGMDVSKSYNIKAYERLKKIPAEHQSRSHFSDWKASQKEEEKCCRTDELVRGVKLSKKGSTVKCTNYKEKGHNKRGCKKTTGGRSAGAAASASGSQAASDTATQRELAAN
uniref:MULE transposase domain-containing protein n=1 Tax=Tanacetum cinerariifolium TaxID=118510 RepID=A0A6L2JVJ0_TANCI|nr:hypothetical protein [Tanacetum cinerariifolium]